MSVCVCATLLLPQSFDLSDATSLQFVPKPARLCLHKYGFEKFTVQLCRLNISYTVFMSVCVCVCVRSTSPLQSVSPCAEDYSFEGKKKKNPLLRHFKAMSRQM